MTAYANTGCAPRGCAEYQTWAETLASKMSVAQKTNEE